MAGRLGPGSLPQNVVQLPQTGGGNGGGGDNMETRLARLEASFEHSASDLKEARGDLKDIRDRMVKLEERVSHLPGKGFIVSVVMTVFALFAMYSQFHEQIAGAVRLQRF